MKGNDIKCCPFCGNDEVEYSAKTVGDKTKDNGDSIRAYYISMFCTKCHCYGPRELVEIKYVKPDNIRLETNITQLTYVTKALNAWNKR